MPSIPPLSLEGMSAALARYEAQRKEDVATIERLRAELAVANDRLNKTSGEWGDVAANVALKDALGQAARSLARVRTERDVAIKEREEHERKRREAEDRYERVLDRWTKHHADEERDDAQEGDRRWNRVRNWGLFLFLVGPALAGLASWLSQLLN